MASADVLKGHLDLLLLSVLAAGPAHGYAVAERLRQTSRGEFDLPEGTLYPALHRLERLGWLSSRWAEVGGRRRRVYQVTAKGQKARATRHAEWTGFSAAMLAVVEGRA